MASIATDETSDHEGDDGDLYGFINELPATPIEEGNNEMSQNQQDLIEACRYGLEDRLVVFLKHGVDLEERDSKGRTVLMYACEFGHRNIVDMLIKAGANVDASDYERITPLMVSCKHRRDEIVELILKYAANINIDAENEKGETALAYASGNGREKAVLLLLNHGADFKCNITPMINAVLDNKINIVQLLIDRGYDVNSAESDGMNALIAAVNPYLWIDIKIVELLLKHGANVHATMCTISPITFCWHTSRTEVLKLLIKNGADVNEGVGENRTLLMEACKYEYINVIECFLQNGADVNAMNCHWETALMYMLRDLEVDTIPIPDIHIAEILLHYGADVNARNDTGMTALMFATQFDLYTFVELFLKHGVDNIDADSEGGMTAVMIAAAHGSSKCLKHLLDAGANENLVDDLEETILSKALANKRKSKECLEVLLEKGFLFDCDGRVKSFYKNAKYQSSCVEAVEATMQLGFFEWEFCSSPYKSMCFAAMKSGYCPGKVMYHHGDSDSDDDYEDYNEYEDMAVSPLIAAFWANDKEAIDTYLRYRYYFPEDYRLLSTDNDIKVRIRDSSLLDKVTLRPLSLFTWSFLTVSKAISLTGRHDSRRQRVGTLPIPDSMKKALNFQLE